MRLRALVVALIVAAGTAVWLGLRDGEEDRDGPGRAPVLARDRHGPEAGLPDGLRARTEASLTRDAVETVAESADGLHDLVVRLVDVDGEPLAGLPVRARAASGVERSGESGPDGRVVLSGLPLEVAEVTFELSGWRPFFGIPGRRVPVPSVDECVLVVPDVAWVRGRVVDEQRRPIPGARVGIEVRGLGGGTLVCAVFVDEDGTYELAYSPEEMSAKHFLCAWAPQHDGVDGTVLESLGPGLAQRGDFVLRRLTGEPDENAERAAEMFTDYAGRQEWSPDFAEEGAGLPSRTVRGRIVQPSGAPMSGARIVADWSGVSSRSGPDGAFTLSVHPWDDLTVEARAHHAALVNPPPDVTDLGDIVLQPRIDVQVRLVFADDSAPAVGAIVWIDPVRATTGADGAATLRGVSPRALEVDAPLFVQPGRADLPQPVQGWSGPIRGEGVMQFRVERGRRVSGTVLRPDGLPLLGAWVWIEEYDLEREAIWTDLEGRFAVPGLPRDRAVAVTVNYDPYEHARLTPPPGPSDEDIDLTMRFPELVTTSGVLRLADDKRVSEVVIRAVPIPPYPRHVLPSEQTVAVGTERTFSFPSVAGQRYRLMLGRSPIYARRLGPEDVVPAGSTDVVAEAHHGASITGEVVDRWGPLARALLRFRNVADDLDRFFVETREGGLFVVHGLEPGATYAVRYKKSKHAPQWIDGSRIVAGTDDVLIRIP